MAAAEPPVPLQSLDGLQIELLVSLGPRQVERVRLSLPAGSTVRQAVEASGVLGRWPGLNQEALAAGEWVVAVWGRKERASHVLKDLDRVELLRGLKVDPKDARRVRYRALGEKLPRGIHRSPKKRVVPAA
jgi:putative ubiquitin-RnfH superfamily antitoxin RatB of RatAB toxin-antitoxin module